MTKANAELYLQLQASMGGHGLKGMAALRYGLLQGLMLLYADGEPRAVEMVETMQANGWLTIHQGINVEWWSFKEPPPRPDPEQIRQEKQAWFDRLCTDAGAGDKEAKRQFNKLRREGYITVEGGTAAICVDATTRKLKRKSNDG